MSTNNLNLTQVTQSYVYNVRNSIPWRTLHNLCCTVPWIRRLLFPTKKQSIAFGPDDAGSAWSSFQLHLSQLNLCGFSGANKFLEIGPGRCLGTSLLWFAHELSRHEQKKELSGVLWDVFPNANPTERTWRELAGALINAYPDNLQISPGMIRVLKDISKGLLIPKITYVVCPLSELRKKIGDGFDFAYSSVALEHAWQIAQTLQTLMQITTPYGWHSHCIDLADHWTRKTNYIEMLNYSPFTNWLMFRFIPGAINRWRSYDYLDFLKQHGFEILLENREVQEELPMDKKLLAKPFCYMNLKPKI